MGEGISPIFVVRPRANQNVANCLVVVGRKFEKSLPGGTIGFDALDFTSTNDSRFDLLL